MSWSSVQCLDANTRPQYHAMSMSTLHFTPAMRLADPYSPAVMLARTNAAIVGHGRVQRSRRKSMANAISLVAVTTPTAGMPVLLHVTAMSHARFVTRSATFNAVMRGARRNAANHARPVLKRNVRLVARTPSATCRVPHHATGCRVRSDVRDFCNAVTNARPFVVQTARTRHTVRSAHQPKSKAFEPT